MADVAKWGDRDADRPTDDGIMEFPSDPGAGRRGPRAITKSHAGATGSTGSSATSRCAGLAFVERPSHGQVLGLVGFFNLDGGHHVSVFVAVTKARGA